MTDHEDLGREIMGTVAPLDAEAHEKDALAHLARAREALAFAAEAREDAFRKAQLGRASQLITDAIWQIEQR